MERVDLSVIGASFAGLSAARAAARRGLDTVVLERKPRVDSGIRTTGLFVAEAAEEFSLPASLSRAIQGVRLYAPSLASIDLSSPGYRFYATDMAGVMRLLAEQAKMAGARISTGRSYPDSGLRSRFLIGADGTESAVARSRRLSLNRKWLVGLEVHLEGVRGLDPDFLHCFLDPALAPGYIAWEFQGTDAVQAGLAFAPPRRVTLEPFLEKLGRLFDLSRARIVERRAGKIPSGGPLRSIGDERTLLVGDAAGWVSPLTGGGIYTALHFGRRSGDAVADHLLEGGPLPAQVLRRAVPSYFWKRQMRSILETGVPSKVLESCLSNGMFRVLAQTVFFHHRGLFSTRAWREALSGLGNRSLPAI